MIRLANLALPALCARGPAACDPEAKKQLSAAFESAARAIAVEPAVLSGADRGWETSRSRVLIAYVLIRRLGYKLSEVVKCLERDIATVSSLVSRYSGRMPGDKELKKQGAVVAKYCLARRRTQLCSDHG